MLRLSIETRILFAAALAISACDTGPLPSNHYTIESIATPVPTVVQQKKVYIGHELPVNVTITAAYAEQNVHLQFYLLSVDDVHYIDQGIGQAQQVRVYYCSQTPYTQIKALAAGTHTYGVVIDVPAGQAQDELTGDFKVGPFYVVADVDSNNQAELDAYNVYRRFAGRLDETNTIFVASDYMTKPDLSVARMNFTGTIEAPHDSMTFFQLDLSKLPGASAANLPSFYIKPSASDRTFQGTIDVKSSSADALNVPIRVFLESTDGSISIPLTLYDPTLKGFVAEYFIPVLRKDTRMSVTLQFRVPDDKDDTYFSAYGTSGWSDSTWENEPNKAAYPLFQLFYAMTKQGLPAQTWVQENVSVTDLTTGQAPAKDYPFKIRAVINPEGEVAESRFILPNEDNSQYTTANYVANGAVYDAANLQPTLTTANDSLAQDLNLRIEKIFVSPNEGVAFYPCSKIGNGNCDPALGYRQMVIFWGGWGAQLGNENLGVGFDAWAGMFFRNYSLFSTGINLYGHVTDFLTGQHLVNAQGGYRVSLDAESHPFESDSSFYDFVVLGSMIPGNFEPGVDVTWGGADSWWQGSFNVFTFKDQAQGFGQYTLNTPITFSKFHIAIALEEIIIGGTLTLDGGYGGIYILPHTRMALNRDGSLRFDVGTSVTMGVQATLTLDAGFELLMAGAEGSIDLVALELDLGAYTKVYYDQVNAPGQVKGAIGLGPSISMTGPQGEVKVWVDLPLLFTTVRLEQSLLSFSAFKVPLYDAPFIESDKTGWVQLARPDLVDYSDPDLLIDGQ